MFDIIEPSADSQYPVRGSTGFVTSRRHFVKFNISSLSRDDDIHLAELKLYGLVEVKYDKPPLLPRSSLKILSVLYAFLFLCFIPR